MTSFETILIKLAETFEAAGVGYMVIGGQAVLAHGEPRQTRDIDVTLALERDHVDKVIALLKSAGMRPLHPDPVGFARQTNVLPMEDAGTALRVDVVFSDLPYEREAVRRAAALTVAGRPVRFATAEDLVIHKLVAGRPIDLQDVRGVWLRKGKDLDSAYIDGWLSQFSKVPGLENVQKAWRKARQ